MKHLTSLILIVILLTNCSNASEKLNNDKSTQADSSKKALLTSLKGIWVTTDYIDDIRQTKSPLKSARKLKGVVTMIIEGRPISDSLEVGISLNNHEGSSFMAYSVPGQNPNSFKTNLPDYDDNSNFYEIGLENINGESVLILSHYNKTKELLDKKQFAMVTESQTDDDAGWGLQFIVNKTLFAGHFVYSDANRSNIKIKLDNGGSVIGFKDFTSYQIATDFMAIGPDEETADAISFKKGDGTEVLFLYEFHGDTLLLVNGKDDIKLTRQTD